jgi:transcriptional regulator with XRE-family HTH domain
MTAPTILDPKLLGFWTKCLRESQHISQDALAASSGLDVRTIQRIEAGNAVSVTTRRCLARVWVSGFNYAFRREDDTVKVGVDVHLRP